MCVFVCLCVCVCVCVFFIEVKIKEADSDTPLFFFISGTRLTKLLEISSNKYQSPRGIVRLTVEWFLSDSLDGTQIINMKDTHLGWQIKWRLEHLGALGIMGETGIVFHSRYSFVLFVFLSRPCSSVQTVVREAADDSVL